MSKRHFIALADFIAGRLSIGIPPHAAFTPDQIDAIAAFLHRENPLFKRDRWIAYIKGECGPCGGARRRD